MQQTDVLIVGAGPTGLVLALWLAKQGCSVRIIDKSSGPGQTSRAMVVQARTLEDSYATERRAFAKKLVETTDRVFTFATAQGSFANFARMRIAPAVASFAYSFGFLREYIFRVISQTSLNYHDSSLSAGKAGKVQAGDRLPWVPIAGADNYRPLSAISWQVHVYGNTKPDLELWCDRHKILLHVFDWNVQYEKAGFARDAVYLLRPDTYVALAESTASISALEQYLVSRGLNLQPWIII